ncbi:MAG TPA: two-component regulator propeller domain-containing protein [Candidatus Angelobacter sp.]|nr:two-component regulator propeller domain-containing protein [Candidatus Angelobacter sp.]
MTPHYIGRRAAIVKLLGLSLLLLGSIPFAMAATPVRKYVRNTWDAGANLPTTWVDAIVQTEDGFIWVGTQQGLARFDGTWFTVFDKNSTKEKLKHNYVYSLLEDKKEKTLWIGTFGGGLARYTAGEFQSYSEEDGLPGKFIPALAQDRHGTLWVGTDRGLAEFKGGKFTPRTEITEEIISLAIAPDDVVWAATAHNIYRVSRVVEKLQLPFHDPKALYFDHEGSAWIGTATHGLYTFRNDKLTHYDSAGPQFHTAAITALYEDRARNLWIGNSAGGLCRLQSHDFDCLVLNGSNKIESIYEDREGNLWVGSQTGGLTRFRDVNFTSYDHKMGVADDLVWGVYQSRDKSIWIATNKGLSVLRNGKIQTIKLGPKQPDNTVFVTAEDADGTLMVGTENGLKALRDGKVIRSYSIKDGLASNTIHALYRDREGEWWISDRDGGLTRYKDGKFTIFAQQNGRPYRVRAVFQDHEGGIWFGTEEGLAQLKGGTFKSFNNPTLLAGGVTTIYEDADHVMWFGTYGSGLVRYKDGQFTTYRTKDGLFDDTMWSLLEDRRGNFWMSCDHGLFRTSKADLNDFAARKIQSFRSRAFGLADDLPTTDFNGGTQATGWKTSDGKLLFATGKGVVELDPENLAPNLVPPPVLIETVRLNGQQFNEQQAPVGLGELDFHFAALSFVAPEMVDFKYRLDPYDPDWKPVKGKRDAHYTNMAPGQYSFHVKAANSDGVWSETGANFEFYLQPRFYQSGWFYFLLGFAVALVGWGIYRLRIRRIRRREEDLVLLVDERTRELQQEVLDHEKTEHALQYAKEAAEAATRAKSEFLANMSHEIRTPLNGVMGILDVMKQMPLTGDQGELLGMAQDSANTLLVVINDILDFSKIEAGKLEFENRDFDLAGAVAEAARTMALKAHQKKLEIAYCLSPEIPSHLVGDAARLKQVLINLIGNAIKFTHVGEVVLRVQVVHQNGLEVELQFAVSDTGIGIPEKKRRLIFDAFEQADASITRKFGGTGLGLAICSRIVNIMGGQLWLESEVGHGSTFYFTARFMIGAAPSLTYEFPGELRGTKVLIVDDHRFSREILQHIVSSWGMLPALAESGGEALRLLHQAAAEHDPFPLLLVDHRMPGMSGLELVQKITLRPELAATAIMMLTSDDYHGTALRCAEMNVGAYLIKPVKQSELLAALRRALVSPKAVIASRPVAPAAPIDSLSDGLRILVAEDNVVNQKLAWRLLEKMGHHVTVAESGIEALEQVQKRAYDLILMDVQMPEMDGFAATQAIREWEKDVGSHIAIIAMTAHAMKGDYEMCLSVGMDGYITKPINSEGLKNTIQQVLRSLEKDIEHSALSSQPKQTF